MANLVNSAQDAFHMVFWDLEKQWGILMALAQPPAEASLVAVLQAFVHNAQRDLDLLLVVTAGKPVQGAAPQVPAPPPPLAP